MSKEFREKFDAKRVRTGTKKQPKYKKGGRQVSLVEIKTAIASQKKALKKAKRQIAALRRKVKQVSNSNDTSDSNPEDAGEDKVIFTKAENIGDGIRFKLTKLSI